MKSLYHIIIVLVMFATTWVSCSNEDTLMNVDLENTQEQNASFTVNFNLSIPDPIQVTSRSGVVEDAIKNITLLCFNNSGKLVSYTTYDNLSGLDGSLTAEITYTTRVIHLIANQDLEVVDPDKTNTNTEQGNVLYLGSSTETAVANLVANNDEMIYWARVEIPVDYQSSAAIAGWFEEKFGGNDSQNAIKMLRNRAKVTVENKDGGDYFTVTGLAVVNASDKGSVAPYYSTDNPFPTNLSNFSLEQWSNDKYIHVPNGANVIGKTASDDVEAGNLLYPYESENSEDAPVSIIIKGYNNNTPDVEKYWRVAIPAYEDGTRRKIRRNHHYKVIITGHLLGGSSSFGAALTAPTANDALLSISDELTAVTDGKFSLTVDKTNYLFAVGQKDEMTIGFTVEYQDGETYIDPSNLSIKWMKNNQSITDIDLKETKLSGNIVRLNGTVSLSIKDWEAGKEEIILIKYGEKLQRKVNISIIPLQQFQNVDCIYYEAGDKNNVNSAIAKLKFTVPKSYPQEMYPFSVLISTNDFNLKRTDGEPLSIIFPGDNGYIESVKDDMGYKYVFWVTYKNPATSVLGDQAYYIDLIGNGVVTEFGTITLESEHFSPITKKIALNNK